jgi:hypothetical protein
MKEKILAVLRKIGVTLVLLLLAFYALTCFYYLPRTVKVNVTGTEVKRHETTLKDGTEQSRDVRYVMTEPLNGGTKVFRNEDTNWGWPPYFKFDSGDLAGQASNFANDASKPVVLATYYGWRVNLLNLYPNLVSMRTVDRSYDHFPLFNYVFIFLSLIGFLFLYLAMRRVAKWRPKAKASSEEPETPEEPAA